VADVDVSLPFYASLGFEVSWRHRLHEDAPRLTCVAREGHELFLTEHAVAPVGAVVHVMVSGLDAIVATAAAHGVAPAFGPELRRWGDREAYFTDPDGNVLRLGESP
jgi:catechol 2,3-dioxygenase-like lactoylglutathione lyase family enzyme